MSSRYKPNWAHLCELAGVTVRELVLASVDRNLNFLKVEPVSPNRGDAYEAWQAYESRLEVAVQRFDEMRLTERLGNEEFCRVNLAEFAHWCAWKGWKLPAEMEVLASEFRNPGTVDPAEWMRYRVWFLNDATLILHGIDPNSTWGEYLKWVFNLKSVSWIKDPSVRKIHRDYHALVSHFGQEGGHAPQAVLEAAQKAGFDDLDPFIDALPADESSEKTTAAWEGFDPDSPTYPPLLDIACVTHRAVTNSPDDSGTPKDRVIRWLAKNCPQLSTNAKKQIAAVCNWDSSPGRRTEKRDS